MWRDVSHWYVFLPWKIWRRRSTVGWNGDPNFHRGHWGRGALRPLQRGQDDGLSSIRQRQRGTCHEAKKCWQHLATYEYRSCTLRPHTFFRALWCDDAKVSTKQGEAKVARPTIGSGNDHPNITGFRLSFYGVLRLERKNIPLSSSAKLFPLLHPDISRFKSQRPILFIMLIQVIRFSPWMSMIMCTDSLHVAI